MFKNIVCIKKGVQKSYILSIIFKLVSFYL